MPTVWKISFFRSQNAICVQAEAKWLIVERDCPISERLQCLRAVFVLWDKMPAAAFSVSLSLALWEFVVAEEGGGGGSQLLFTILSFMISNSVLQATDLIQAPLFFFLLPTPTTDRAL